MSSDEFEEIERHFPAHVAAAAGDTKALYQLISDASENEDAAFSYRLKDDILNERSNRGWTPMHVAIASRQLEVLKILLEEGIEPRRLDGSPCLHFALCLAVAREPSTKAFVEAASALLRPKVDLLAKDDRKQSTLHVAAHYGLVESVKALASARGEELLELKDRTGNRALHFAVLNPDQDADAVEVVKALLAASATVDCVQARGQTPLHLAGETGFWAAFRLLVSAGADVKKTDKRGLTAAQMALQNGYSIPADLQAALRGTADMENGSGEEVQVPPGRTAILSHPLCRQHFTCPPIDHGSADPPPENVNRLKVLLDEPDGVLRAREFQDIEFSDDAKRADLADVLRVHDWDYVRRLQMKCAGLNDFLEAEGGPSMYIPELGNGRDFELLDGDTVISARTFEAALRAAGSVIEGVDRVMSGQNRNVFCAVRPPGHHAGLRGVVTNDNDKSGSHGFCLLNNVGIAAAYARHCYRGKVDKVAIVDFDVHHGNGTEEVVRNVVPSREKYNYQTPFCSVTTVKETWKPWLNEEDHEKVLFVSSHGYGKNSSGWFYPGSGSTCLPKDASVDFSPDVRNQESEFFDEETNTFSGYESETREDSHRILDLGLALPNMEVPGTSRYRFRDGYRKVILPRLMAFKPDLILISAGFDGHKKDDINFGFLGLVEEDFEWVTDELIKVANSCCEGRVVSVLEGGYAIKGHHVSAFARSAAAHVRSLHRGSRIRKKWDAEYCTWESKMELRLLNKARERQEKKNRQMLMWTTGQGELDVGASEDEVAKGAQDWEQRADGSLEAKAEDQGQAVSPPGEKPPSAGDGAKPEAPKLEEGLSGDAKPSEIVSGDAASDNAASENAASGNATAGSATAGNATSGDLAGPVEEPAKKRRRKHVDYVALSKKMIEEGLQAPDE